MSDQRLLIVSDYAWDTGGVEEFVFQLLLFVRETHDSRVVSWSDGLKLPPDYSGLRTVHFGDVRGLWAELDAADVVLVVTSFNVRLLARSVCDYLDERQTPTIVVVQTSGHSDAETSASQAQEKWLRGLARGCATTVAVSRDVASALGQIDGFPTDRIVVIENAARLTHVSLRERERTSVAFIGRPHPQKGYHLFARLVRETADERIQFAANTVSVRPDDPIQGVRHSYKLSDTDLIEFFEATDLVIAPYLRADGLPLAILEALNCGVPVLGFDVPGVGGLLREHGQIVVPPAYSALKSTFENWRNGVVTVEAPPPGSVQTWPGQLAQYVALLHEATNLASDRAMRHRD